MKDNKLENLRTEIDNLDQKIQTLITSRAELAKEVAKVKKEANKESAFYRPEREAQILKRVIKRNDSFLKDKDVALIF